ncbi:hypothetical protein G7078_04900 [Sphingomonas sinipercae]|uniref:Uncharacterized protein n=1 Tax=Sphingomonas sinipercae TaxID=2714944 RepID=A0A6G7ZMP3_9SPHN|nr:hypothetical protein [Sphingomonas sinipercae]QIL02188.1 hypothetical protein G7078_04900 [Sphingomonas sinipercae]
MDDGGLATSFDRAERALGRIERAIRERPKQLRDEELRAKVGAAIAELDQMVRAANG